LASAYTEAASDPLLTITAHCNCQDDERIKTFPFPTRRPALTELIRCYHELTRVKLSFYTATQLHEAETAYLASIAPKPAPSTASTAQAPAAPTKPKLSEDEERLRERWRRLLEMVRKGKVDTLAAFSDKWDGTPGMAFGGRGELPAWLIEEDAGRREATLLMAAVVAGQEAVVRWLLEEKRADPTVPVPAASGGGGAGKTEDEDETSPDAAEADGADACLPSTFRTAYDLASAKSVRNVFRRLAHDHPDWWAWTSISPGGARVPSGLSAEQEEQQKQKGGERRKGLKDKMKARRAAAPSPPPEPEPAAEPPVGAVTAALQATALKGPQRLGGQGTAVDLGQSLQGLTAEMRTRIERERRARAAEARMSGR
jgi:hypothetical protein